MASKFVSVMETIGNDVKAVWSDVVKYLPAAAKLAELIFPAETAVIGSAINSVDLIQQAVVTVEQKFAAAGNPTGTGTQKLAQVLSIVSPTVTQLLSSEKVPVDSAYVTDIVNAVVAILNVQASAATA
jgi:hypothetical protein